MTAYIIRVVLISLILFVPILIFINDELKAAPVSQEVHQNRPRYHPVVLGFLPITFVMIPFVFFNEGLEVGMMHLSSEILTTILIITIYYPIVYFALNKLRSRYMARTVAMLWSLPNSIYLLYLNNSSLSTIYRIYLSMNSLYILLGVWMAGFVGVLGYYIIEHIHFKHLIMKKSQLISDERILEACSVVETHLGITNKHSRKHLKVYYNPELSTPLSFSNRIILPSLEYSDEELYLILNHELIHILRSDSTYKFYIAFCRAFCWFNPFVWKCLRKNADDIELSCDEAVLKNRDDSFKKKYASLILSIAGDERGFTTCLSANGKALKYRLSNILADNQKKKVGYPVILILLSLILFCSGFISIGISGKRLKDTTWSKAETVYFAFDPSLPEEKSSTYEKDQIAKLEAYLNTLELCKVEYIDYDFDDYYVTITAGCEDYFIDLMVYDHVLTVIDSSNDTFNYEYYYFKDEIDEEYIASLF